MRLLTGALVALSLTASAAAGPGASHTVTIENMQFQPQELIVHRGDRIVWVNKDLFPHTVTADKIFDSGSIASNASWSYSARKSGEYAYGCTFHPTMKGKLKVQ
ncbi:MAG TPA: cupredoxin family copper-binding protein [Stellaceae bacterium]|nr:cupredoxin family copper-binding protein [Stellaceae bacterium]